MSEPSPTPTTQLSPLGQAAQQDGIVLTQMLIVADFERSVSFLPRRPRRDRPARAFAAMLRFHNGWLVINSGGGPTPDKPEVTLTPPEDLNRVSTMMNIRVADIATVYREWNERGAQFLTEPLDNHGAEKRCYLRDPDGYLIELGATSPRPVAA